MKFRIQYTVVQDDKTYVWFLTTTFDSIFEAIQYLHNVNSIAFDKVFELIIKEDK